MMRAMRPLARAAAVLCCLAAAASAYYPFVHYASLTAPFTPIAEKFDLAALPDKTVSLYVSEVGPVRMATGDSFASVVTQVRMAAKVWNDVGTSELRVAFGGLFTPGTPQTAPRIEVVFDDVPGVLARCAPVSRLEPVSGPGGPFVPIVASSCILNQDISQRPSFGEAFFMTTVHELGHALGLQHAMTSSAMSTELTRATTRAVPLAADDVAGISALYPTPQFLVQTGSITGQVTMAGLGVHMASVVALAPERAAVSALANPDGTYRIDGLAPGQYYVYVHPLPASQSADLGPAEIVLPLDAELRPIPAGEAFGAQFFPGVRDPQQAMMVTVNPGTLTADVNFAVEQRSAPQLYAVTTYSFPGQVAVKPAHLSASAAQSLVAIASSPQRLTAEGAPALGLNIAVLGGGPAIQRIRAYPPAPHYLEVDFALGQSNPGPRHLVFTVNNELYVLPSAFQVVASPPPSVTAVLPGFDSHGNRWAAVVGANFTPDTRVVFDGLPARRVDYFPGAIVVTPPPGAANYQATVTALNSDGQSSLFLQAQAPATYTYEPGEPPAIWIAPAALPAGAEAMIEIMGVNTNFAEGHTAVGFGSSDIAARRIWVMSPTRLRVQVSVAASNPSIATLVSVVSGFQVIAQPFAFQVQPANPRLPVINPQLFNPATGQPSVYPGSPAVALVPNLLPYSAIVSPVLFLNDQQIAVASLAPGQVTFSIPAGFPLGPAVLRLQYGAEQIYPVIVNIDAPPPAILAVTTGVRLVDASWPAKPGDYLIVVVSGLADPGATVAPSRIRITVGGIEHQALAVAPAVTPVTAHQILFALSGSITTGQHALTVSIDGRASLPFPLHVRPQ